MSCLKARKLSELGFVGRGRSRHRPRDEPSLYGGPYPFFQTGEIKAADLYLTEYSQTYSEEGLAQSKLWEPGTLCITIAANIADTAILGVRGCFPDSVVGFVADPDKADVRYVKYYIDTLQSRMQGVSRGTTQDNLSLEKLLAFELLTPSVEEQRRLAGILASYDDLIEKNLRRIRILEEMARVLYREWFVELMAPGVSAVMGDGVPTGWQFIKLSSIADVNRAQINTKAPPDRVLYIDISSVGPGIVREVSELAFAEAPSRARRIVQHGDILWSCVRPNRRSHVLVLSPELDTVASTGFSVLTATKVPFTFLYQATTTDAFVAHLANHATGAAYPAVTAKTFENAEILVPPADLLERFAQVTTPMAELIANLQRQNLNLRATRDLLLPRLMSGQLSLADLNGQVTLGTPEGATL